MTRLTQLRLGWNADAAAWGGLATRVSSGDSAALVPAAGFPRRTRVGYRGRPR
jgi:hypothetical protein